MNTILPNLPTLEEIDQLVASGAIGFGKLSPDEIRQAREDRKHAPTRNKIGEKGEGIAQNLFERRFGANLKKSPVVPRPGGYGFYSTDVDLVGSIGPNARHIRIECKTTRDGRIPFSSLNKNERKYLNDAIRHGEIALIVLVWLNKDMDCVLIHAISWQDFQALEQSMAGEYGGKSLKKADWKKRLLKYAIPKEGGRYQIPATYWLHSIIN